MGANLKQYNVILFLTFLKRRKKLTQNLHRTMVTNMLVWQSRWTYERIIICVDIPFFYATTSIRYWTASHGKDEQGSYRHVVDDPCHPLFPPPRCRLLLLLLVIVAVAVVVALLCLRQYRLLDSRPSFGSWPPDQFGLWIVCRRAFFLLGKCCWYRFV
jgi:hypothetical protein